MRAYFFGRSASTSRVSAGLAERFPDAFEAVTADIRDRDALLRLFRRHRKTLGLVIHCAAQPSHDWAARNPFTDFDINAVGTLNLLEALRIAQPSAPFIFMSTNKVYGDRPNGLPLEELATRWELPRDHEWYDGIPTCLSIDQTTHSVFGASKVAADVLVQEYGRYFRIPTVCFRGGCLTGPQHAGVELHGFLAYLMRCVATRRGYTVFGYKAKQVRDNIHAADVVSAFEEFFRSPRIGAVYNLGGGRQSNVSMLEAIALCEEIAGECPRISIVEQPRTGDHQWYVSGLSEFERDYPAWRLTRYVSDILTELYEANIERWLIEEQAA
jgi:CDP-paratose 2-epimerase